MKSHGRRLERPGRPPDRSFRLDRRLGDPSRQPPAAAETATRARRLSTRAPRRVQRAPNSAPLADATCLGPWTYATAPPRCPGNHRSAQDARSPRLHAIADVGRSDRHGDCDEASRVRSSRTTARGARLVAAPGSLGRRRSRPAALFVFIRDRRDSSRARAPIETRLDPPRTRSAPSPPPPGIP